MATRQISWTKTGSTAVVGAARPYDTRRAELSVSDRAGRSWQFALRALTEEGGSTWVVRESDFYVRSRSSVTGARLALGGELQWHEALLSDKSQERALAGAAELGLESLALRRDSPATPLGPVLGPWYFVRGEQSSELVVVSVASAALEDGLLRVDLENVMQARASVWLALETREVVRAMEDGRTMFPR